MIKRISAKKKARELAKYLRAERPDYAYLKSLFQHLRTELEVEVPKAPKKLPYVPSEEELKRYYEVVWKDKIFQDMMIVKTLLYTGVRVSELINIKLTDIDFYYCQIRINKGKGNKDRIVPFPQSFKELLAMHADSMQKKQATYLDRKSVV
jgi:integrase/recombinase XerD